MHTDSIGQIPLKHPQSPVVAIVGTGNVATHLGKALSGKVNLHQVNPHSFYGMPTYADIVIISVKDSVIKEVAKNVPGEYGIIAHTSGSVPMDILSECKTDSGVFYPLQTFTKEVALDYSGIPFFIEGTSEQTVKSLSELATKISDNVHLADSEKRKVLHLASVFACNFSNSMIAIADDLLKDINLDYKILLPLLQQTISKLQDISPARAQTGPAARKDFPVIDAHVNMLMDNGHGDLAEIYESLTSQIIRRQS